MVQWHAGVEKFLYRFHTDENNYNKGKQIRFLPIYEVIYLLLHLDDKHIFSCIYNIKPY